MLVLPRSPPRGEVGFTGKVGQSRLSLRSMFCGNSYNDILAYFVSLGSENAGGTRIVITPVKCAPHFASANAVAAMPPEWPLFPRPVQRVKLFNGRCICRNVHARFVFKPA